MKGKAVTRGSALLAWSVAAVAMCGGAAQAAPPLAASASPVKANSTVVLVRPCAAGSTEAKAAEGKLDALTQRIEALAPSGNPEPIAADLSALARDPCFALLPILEHPLTFTSSLSLREYWKTGGRTFFEQVFHWHERVNGSPLAWLSPTPRKSLTLDASPTHALAGTMLCGERDAACGTESEGFRKRAETFFTLFDRSRHLARGGARSDDAMGECARVARTKPARERFVTWRACMGKYAEERTRFPLGRFRVPREGWLVVRGRRGHYSFCDEVRAYDLATGAAYVAKSCSGLALVSDGSVDGQKTDAARRDELQIGRLPVDALREAAWMLALAGECQPRVSEGFGWYVPDDIEIVRPETQVLPSIQGGSWSSSSAQTTLAWSWERGGSRVTSGTVRWPNDYNDAAREHAVQLLHIAELGLVEGCAAVPAPTATILAATPRVGVSPIDASASSVSGAQNALVDAIVRQGSSRVCKR